MAASQNSLFFSVFVVTLLVICSLGLAFFQILAPVNTTTDIPRVDYSLWQKSNTEEEPPEHGDQDQIAPTLYTVSNLISAFEKVDFTIEKAETSALEVPRLYLSKFPADLAGVQNVQERKNLFFKILLPLVLRINEEIIGVRKRLFQLTHRLKLNQKITPQDHLWLETQFNRYGVKAGDLNTLLLKIDQIPASLILAQAAEESGWGTSRFVREGNALFGQWTFNPNDRGIVPDQRSADKSHRIRAFNSLSDSLRAYVFNLNSHHAYENFRLKRAQLRRNPTRLIGQRLASTLDQYSERGESYVQSLHTLIRQNNLRRFDQAVLKSEEEIVFQNLVNLPVDAS